MSPEPRSRSQALAAALLLVVGSLQMVGSLLGSPTLARLGRASMAAPLPLVFGRVGELETFSRRFALVLETRDGERIRLPGDRDLAARLDGPFTRRSIHLGALTYWHLLPEPDRSERVRFGFCGDAPLARELGIEAPLARVTIRTWSARGPEEPDLRLEVACPR